MRRHKKTILLAVLATTTVAMVAVLAATVGSGGDRKNAKASDDRATDPTPIEPEEGEAPAAAKPQSAVSQRFNPPPARDPAAQVERQGSTLSATAEADPSEDRRALRDERRRGMLATYDKDGSGHLEDAEREQMHKDRLAGEFQRLDKNGDGNLSLDEFQAQEGPRFGGQRFRGMRPDREPSQ